MCTPNHWIKPYRAVSVLVERVVQGHVVKSLFGKLSAFVSWLLLWRDSLGERAKAQLNFVRCLRLYCSSGMAEGDRGALQESWGLVYLLAWRRKLGWFQTNGYGLITGFPTFFNLGLTWSCCAVKRSEQNLFICVYIYIYIYIYVHIHMYIYI